MLPQGMFSVALATVLFPSLSRLVARHDSRRPAAARRRPARARTCCCSSRRRRRRSRSPTPIVELIYQHGAFGPSSTDEVAEALFWFAFSLPFAGINLLLTRTFFSLQRPWITDGPRGREPRREPRGLARALQAARASPAPSIGTVVATPA